MKIEIPYVAIYVASWLFALSTFGQLDVWQLTSQRLLWTETTYGNDNLSGNVSIIFRKMK